MDRKGSGQENSHLDNVARYEALRQRGYIDIAEEFPFSDALDFVDFIWDSWRPSPQVNRKPIARFPIVGTADGHVYMLLQDLVNDEQQHATLLNLLGIDRKNDKEKIAFTTSLESHSSDHHSPNYIAIPMPEGSGMPETFHIVLGEGTDIPGIRQLITEREEPVSEEALQHIFSKIGATVVVTQ
jgi:hypothetical protein